MLRSGHVPGINATSAEAGFPDSSSALLGSSAVDQREDLVDGTVELVVDHGDGAQLLGGCVLASSLLEPPLNVRVGIAAMSETGGLLVGAGGGDEDEQRVDVAFAHLASTLHVDLQQHVEPRRWHGHRRPVEMAEELGMLEESAAGQMGFEGRPVDEGVSRFVLVGTRRPRGPRSTQPQARIELDETSGDRALADPAGTREDDDETGAIGQLPTASSSAARC